MSRYTSAAELLDELSPELPAVGPGWHDVLARAELLAAANATDGRAALPRPRPRRRYVIPAFGIAALVAAVVAAAYALGHPIIDFDKAPKGPRNVVNFFGALRVFPPPASGPGGVLPHEARRITSVRIDGKDHVLWVAPAKGGGFCYEWSGLAGSCRARAYGNDVHRLATGGAYERRVLAFVEGSFFRSAAERIVLTYADGRTSEIPFVWVTAPIGAGFFAFDVPDTHRRRGHEAVSVALLDSSGHHVIEHQRLLGVEPRRPVTHRVRHRLSGYPALMVPARAEWSRRRQLFDRRTENGIHIGLWTARRRGGGTCFWTNQASGCSTPDTPAQVSLKVKRGRNYVSLCCTVASNVVRVEARFEDGDRVELRAKDGYLVWPIPRRHYPPGHRLDELSGYSAAGAEIATSFVATDVRRLYPCSKPKHYGYGISMCP
jgi:hypothetical protein